MASLLLGCSIVRAQAPLQPWDALGENLASIYGWPNTLFHLSAAASTPPIALLADRPVQDFFQEEDPLTNTFGDVALVTGGVAPAAVPLVLLLGGMAEQDSELQSAGAALIQAEVIQLVMVSALKWMTDRTGPFPDGDPTARRWHASVLRDSDDPRDFDFNPFDISGGLRWPSGHTAATVTLVSTLVAFYPQEHWLAFLGYPLAAAVGVGMIEGDYHWLSDVVAGALIGHVIGWEVGGRFRARLDAREREEPQGSRVAPPALQLSIRPAPQPGPPMLVLNGVL